MGGNGKMSKDELKRLLEEVEAEGFEGSKEKMMLKRLNDAARRGALPSPFLMCHLNDHDNKVKGEQK